VSSICGDREEDRSATRLRKLRVHVTLGNRCRRTCISGNQLNAGINVVARGTDKQSRRRRWRLRRRTPLSRETRGAAISSNSSSSSSRRHAHDHRVANAINGLARRRSSNFPKSCFSDGEKLPVGVTGLQPRLCRLVLPQCGPTGQQAGSVSHCPVHHLVLSPVDGRCFVLLSPAGCSATSTLQNLMLTPTRDYVRPRHLSLYHNCDSTAIRLRHDYDEKLTC